MFLSFYGLNEQPFGVTPDPEFLYMGATHREALASVSYGIQAGVGFAAVIARPGMGKTTLLFAMLRQFQNSTQSAFLFDTQCTSKELLQNLLAEFKIQEENGRSDTSALACLRQFLLRNARANRRVLVVVDEAQNLDIPVFETLRLLSNFETSHAKLLHIVLAGQPELGRKLALPELEQLRQRITIVSRLDAFAPADVIRYVAHRLKRAGYRGGALFTPEALGILVDKSHGVPREINRLCFNAMSLGCALGKKLIDGQMVREAAADLEFGPQPNQEERVQGHRISETADELAAWFTTALQTPAPAKEKAKHITPEQELPQAGSARTVSIETERQPQTAARPVPEQLKAVRGETAGKIAKPSFVSAWLSSVLGAVAALRVRVRNAFGEIVEKMLNWRAKLAAVPPRARQSQRLGFRGWSWGLTAVAASVFGGLIWLSNFHGARAFAAQFVPATQRFVSETQKSAKQWLTPLKSAFASETEKVDHSNAAKLVSRPQESARQLPTRREPIFVSKKDEDHSKMNSSRLEGDLGASLTPPELKTTSAVAEANTDVRATDATPSTTPAVHPGSRNQKTLKATGLPNKPAAPTGNNVHKTQFRVSLAGTPIMNHFATAAVIPPPPEITIAPMLITRVDPIYPQPARDNGISGGVVLNAHIDETGKVQEVQTISGDPVLVPAAVDAVRQWGYQPSLVNGQPRQSDMRIEINFSLR